MFTQLDQASFGWFHLKLMLLNGACWILAGYGVTIIGFLLPTLSAEWNVSEGSLGVMAGAGMAGMLIGSIPGGYPFRPDRSSEHHILDTALCWNILPGFRASLELWLTARHAGRTTDMAPR
jgi:hypothetical protein